MIRFAFYGNVVGALLMSAVICKELFIFTAIVVVVCSYFLERMLRSA